MAKIVFLLLYKNAVEFSNYNFVSVLFMYLIDIYYQRLGAANTAEN